MKAYVILPESDQFFFNGSYLKEYVSATSISKKHSVSGHYYFFKMDSFIQSHVIPGEMHLEFRKGRCLDKGRSCEFCLTNAMGYTQLKVFHSPYLTMKNYPIFTIFQLTRHPYSLRMDQIEM